MNIIKQRYYDRLASNLIFLSLAIWNGINVFSSGGYFQSPAHRQPTIIAAALAVLGTMALLAVGIRKGKFWAKLLFVIVFINGAFSMAKYLLRRDGWDVIQVTHTLLTYGLQVVAVFCCFLYMFTKDNGKPEKSSFP
ncbi:hypothetical protein SAMN00120144_4215 [Hymenobacter roseosalivarius DSM 11622]|uniref:Transmembrane protein n=1 Tax=Hymenobacter roseosalivarius DSM 11622 TaxID=645990 RepID=A0A1W1UF86_9BACT|nr:hypothetical protein [Hymenobacter roseosalivarius]SMB79765.1 hypothetical protein SAMN00120144_4215 [Hymenobacter roseosalivarius DSM 11622]